MMKEVPSLAKIRYNLCPSMLTEQQFWAVYFTLMSKRLGNCLQLKTADDIVKKEYKQLQWVKKHFFNNFQLMAKQKKKQSYNQTDVSFLRELL